MNHEITRAKGGEYTKDNKNIESEVAEACMESMDKRSNVTGNTKNETIERGRGSTRLEGDNYGRG